MCGIFGTVAFNNEPLLHPRVGREMARSLRHRGPDADGIHQTNSAIIGATRLRINDPRTIADQPYKSADASVLVCNGEVYNSAELRNRYAQYSYRTLCDIEVLIPLLESEGPDALHRVNGMFALASWTPHRQHLLLARDVTGQKPLFYSVVHNEVRFASEIQTLLGLPNCDRSMDEQAIEDYLTLGYVLEPRTLFRSIRRVPSGTYLRFSTADLAPRPTPYAQPFDTRPPPSPHEVREALTRAVLAQHHADVPVGVFLSGGLDSTAVASIAVQQGPPSTVHSYSVGFTQDTFDERGWAQQAAQFLGTRHHEVVVDNEDLARIFGHITSRCAEPVADPAILPTYALAQRARVDVGAVLGGEGADELFGGYPTYVGHQWAERFTGLPKSAQKLLLAATARSARSAHRVTWGWLLQRFARNAADEWQRRHVSWFGTGLVEVLPQHIVDSVLARLPGTSHADLTAQAMCLDRQTYLREGLLVKLDRATMMHGLEARLPYLDQAVMAMASQVPSDQSVGRIKTKKLLKRAVKSLVPPAIRRRRKQGLSVPIGTLINTSLRERVDDLLDESRIHQQGVLPSLPIAQLLAAHRAGISNNARPLWALLNFQAWYEHWGS